MLKLLFIKRLDSLMAETFAEHIEDQERHEQEKAEDEARWQRYIRTGEAISREDMSRKLQSIASRTSPKTS